MTKKEITTRENTTLLTPAQIELLKRTIAKDTTDDELSMFLHLAQKYQLDPFAKEIFCYKQPTKYGQEQVVMMAGRDGYLAIAHRSGQFDGLESGTIEDSKGQIIKGWAIVYRKDMSHPFKTEAKFSEYNRNNYVWQKYPSAMIIKVAEAMALKRAFSISGLVTEEEIEMVDITPKNGGYNHIPPSIKIHPEASQKAEILPKPEPEIEEPTLIEPIINDFDGVDPTPEPEPKPEKKKERTTTNYKFLEEMKRLKEVVGEEKYYTCLKNFGYEKSNQITKREEQEIVYRSLRILEEKKNSQNRNALWQEFQTALAQAIANGYSEELELNYCVSNYYPINTFEELKNEELRKEIKRLNKIKVNKQ